LDLALTNVATGGTVISSTGQQTYTPTGGEAITLNALSISGSTITNTGTSSITVSGFGSDPLMDGAATLNATGAFAGPSGEEILGSFSATAANTGDVQGLFTGSSP
ncbi:MAG: hypothetical protein ACPGVK_10825, partial [Halocynthiibacter sp.]